MPSYYSGPTVTREQAAHLAYQAGARGDDLIFLTAIPERESSYNAGAHRTDSPRERLSGDRGLWQINYIWDNELKQAGIINQASDLFDPLTNARAAVFVMRRQGRDAWAMGSGGWQSGGNPLKGVNMQAAQLAVQRAASQGIIGQDWSQGAATGPTSATGANNSTGGPMQLPSDARLVQSDNGLFALFQVMPGLWVHYQVPRDGTVVISGSIERLSDTAYAQKYGNSVDAGNIAELEDVQASYGGRFANYRDETLAMLFPPGDPRSEDAEIMRLFAIRLGRPNMSSEEWTNLLSATQWYQSRTEGEIAWNDLSEAERQQRRNDMAARMRQAYQSYVGQAPDMEFLMGHAHLEALASGAMGFGQWTEQVLKPAAEERPESPWSRQLRDEKESQRERGVSIENTINQLRGTLDRWGLRWDEKTLLTYGRALVENRMSDDDLNKIIRAQAKAKYPWKDESMETIVAAAPWIESYNRLMERQGSLTTPEVQEALVNGETVLDFEKRIQSTEAWANETKNGRDKMYSTIGQVAADMGFA